MSARIGEHIRSNVFAYLVVFLAVTVVPAYAATTVKVPKNAVKSKQIKDGQVKAVDADSAQIQLRIGSSCPSGQAIRVVNVDGTVACEVDDAGSGGGSGAPTGAAAGDLTGTYPNPQIANLAVTIPKLAFDPATQPELDALAASDGNPPNTGANFIHWNVLNGVPAGFADGVDDTGGSPPPAWLLAGNAATNPATDFLGTTDNQPLIVRVNNQRALRIEPNATSPNLIGGIPGNSADAGVVGATVAGGGQSGIPNIVTDDFGAVGGGQGNRAGDNSMLTFGTYATVGGGSSNTASGGQATVGGGFGNTAADAWATVGGGEGNGANGSWATVAGGDSNAASDQAAVSGGSGNTAGSAAAVGGGIANNASGGGAAIGGGVANNASGIDAAVPGGEANVAAGDYSLVAGRRAKNTDPLHDGVFLFADSTDADFASAAANEFAARASGGFRFLTDAAATLGCALPGGSEILSCGGFRTRPQTTLPSCNSAAELGRIAYYDDLGGNDRLAVCVDRFGTIDWLELQMGPPVP